MLINFINMSKKSAKAIVIVGMMGVGKSSVGKTLAREINYKFFDSDNEIENASNLNITEIFEKYGEAYFRHAEFKIINNIISKNENIILSIGGGAYCNEKIKNLINENSRVVYLRASIKTLVSRLKNNLSSRPLLRGKDLKQKITFLTEEREKYYQEADYILEVDNLHINEIVEKIIKSFNIRFLND